MHHLFLIIHAMYIFETAIKYRKNTKCDGKDAGQRQQSIMTKGEMAKLKEMARTKLIRLERETEEAKQSVARAREDIAAIQIVSSVTSRKLQALECLRENLEREVSQTQFEKARLQELLELNETLLQRYESLNRGEVPPVTVSARTEFEVDKKMTSSSQKNQKLSEVIHGLSMKFPEYGEIFDRLHQVATEGSNK